MATCAQCTVGAVRVQSGWFFPSGDDGVDEWSAARHFPELAGWVVVFAHGIGAGDVVVGGRRVAAAEFAGRVRDVVGSAKRLLLMVCDGAAGLAEPVRAVVRCDVLAADGIVWHSRRGVRARSRRCRGAGAWRWFGPGMSVAVGSELAGSLASVTPGCGEWRLGGIGPRQPVAWVRTTSALDWEPNLGQAIWLKRLKLTVRSSGFANAVIQQAGTDLSLSTPDVNAVHAALADGFAAAYGRHANLYNTLLPRNDDGSARLSIAEIESLLRHGTRLGKVGDALPWLAAQVFGVRVNVLFDNGAVVTIGSPTATREVWLTPTHRPVGQYLGLTTGEYRPNAAKSRLMAQLAKGGPLSASGLVAGVPSGGEATWAARASARTETFAGWVSVHGRYDSMTDTIMMTELRKFDNGKEHPVTSVLTFDWLVEHVRAVPNWNRQPVVLSVAGGASLAARLAVALETDVLAARRDPTASAGTDNNAPVWVHATADGNVREHAGPLHDVIDVIGGMAEAQLRFTGTSGDNGPIEFRAEQVHSVALRDRNDTIIGVSFAGETEIIDWVKNIPDQETHHSGSLEQVGEQQVWHGDGLAQDAPWSGLRPIRLHAHGDRTGFHVNVNTGTVGAPVWQKVLIDAPTYVRIVLGTDHFHQAAAALDGRGPAAKAPVVLLSCQTGHPLGDAGDKVTTALHDSGQQREVYAPYGTGLRFTSNGRSEYGVATVVTNGTEHRGFRHYGVRSAHRVVPQLSTVRHLPSRVITEFQVDGPKKKSANAQAPVSDVAIRVQNSAMTAGIWYGDPFVLIRLLERTDRRVGAEAHVFDGEVHHGTRTIAGGHLRPGDKSPLRLVSADEVRQANGVYRMLLGARNDETVPLVSKNAFPDMPRWKIVLAAKKALRDAFAKSNVRADGYWAGRDDWGNAIAGYITVEGAVVKLKTFWPVAVPPLDATGANPWVRAENDRLAALRVEQLTATEAVMSSETPLPSSRPAKPKKLSAPAGRPAAPRKLSADEVIRLLDEAVASMEDELSNYADPAEVLSRVLGTFEEKGLGYLTKASDVRVRKHMLELLGRVSDRAEQFDVKDVAALSHWLSFTYSRVKMTILPTETLSNKDYVRWQSSLASDGVALALADPKKWRQVVQRFHRDLSEDLDRPIGPLDSLFRSDIDFALTLSKDLTTEHVEERLARLSKDETVALFRDGVWKVDQLVWRFDTLAARVAELDVRDPDTLRARIKLAQFAIQREFDCPATPLTASAIRDAVRTFEGSLAELLAAGQGARLIAVLADLDVAPNVHLDENIELTHGLRTELDHIGFLLLHAAKVYSNPSKIEFIHHYLQVLAGAGDVLIRSGRRTEDEIMRWLDRIDFRSHVMTAYGELVRATLELAGKVRSGKLEGRDLRDQLAVRLSKAAGFLFSTRISDVSTVAAQLDELSQYSQVMLDPLKFQEDVRTEARKFILEVVAITTSPERMTSEKMRVEGTVFFFSLLLDVVQRFMERNLFSENDLDSVLKNPKSNRSILVEMAERIGLHDMGPALDHMIRAVAVTFVDVTYRRTAAQVGTILHHLELSIGEMSRYPNLESTIGSILTELGVDCAYLPEAETTGFAKRRKELLKVLSPKAREVALKEISQRSAPVPAAQNSIAQSAGALRAMFAVLVPLLLDGRMTPKEFRANIVELATMVSGDPVAGSVLCLRVHDLGRVFAAARPDKSTELSPSQQAHDDLLALLSLNPIDSRSGVGGAAHAERIAWMAGSYPSISEEPRQQRAMALARNDQKWMAGGGAHTQSDWIARATLLDQHAVALVRDGMVTVADIATRIDDLLNAKVTNLNQNKAAGDLRNKIKNKHPHIAVAGVERALAMLGSADMGNAEYAAHIQTLAWAGPMLLRARARTVGQLVDITIGLSEAVRHSDDNKLQFQQPVELLLRAQLNYHDAVANGNQAEIDQAYQRWLVALRSQIAILRRAPGSVSWAYYQFFQITPPAARAQEVREFRDGPVRMALANVDKLRSEEIVVDLGHHLLDPAGNATMTSGLTGLAEPVDDPAHVETERIGYEHEVNRLTEKYGTRPLGSPERRLELFALAVTLRQRGVLRVADFTARADELAKLSNAATARISAAREKVAGLPDSGHPLATVEVTPKTGGQEAAPHGEDLSTEAAAGAGATPADSTAPTKKKKKKKKAAQGGAADGHDGRVNEGADESSGPALAIETQPVLSQTTAAMDGKTTGARLSGVSMAGLPINFTVGQVHSVALSDANGKVVGTSFPSEPGDERVPDWTARPATRTYVSGAAETASGPESASLPTPWTTTPIHVHAHANRHAFFLSVNLGTERAPVWEKVGVTGESYARVVAANRFFRQAAAANPDAPIFSMSCEAGHPDATAGPAAAAALRELGYRRDLYAPTGKGVRYRRSGESEYQVLPGTDRAGNLVPGSLRHFVSPATAGPQSSSVEVDATAGASSSGPPDAVYLLVPSSGRSAVESVLRWLAEQGERVTVLADRPTANSGEVLVEVSGQLVDSVSRSGTELTIEAAALRKLEPVQTKAAKATPARPRSNLGQVSSGTVGLPPSGVSTGGATVRLVAPLSTTKPGRLDGPLALPDRKAQKAPRTGLVFAAQMSTLDALQARSALPEFDGVRMVAGSYSAKKDKLKSGGGEYTVDEFARRFGGQPDILGLLAGGAAGDGLAGERSYATRVAVRSRRTVIAAVGDVVQLPGGRIVAGRVTNTDSKEPVLSAGHGVGWQVFYADGTSRWLAGYEFSGAVEQVLAMTDRTAVEVKPAGAMDGPVVWSATDAAGADTTAIGGLGISLPLTWLTKPVVAEPSPLTALAKEPRPGYGVAFGDDGVYFSSGIDEEDLLAGLAVQAWDANFAGQLTLLYSHADPEADRVPVAGDYLTYQEFAERFTERDPESTKPIMLVMCGGGYAKQPGAESMGAVLARVTGRIVLTIGGILWQTARDVVPVPFDLDLLRNSVLHPPPAGTDSHDLADEWGWMAFLPTLTSADGRPKSILLGADLTAAISRLAEITQLALTPPSSVASPNLVEPVAWVRRRST